jgi:hypothetical protein
MQSEMGLGMIFQYLGDDHIASRFKKNFATLMKTEADNITMTTNTSEAISMIANGYPFEPGDQVISYVNEYPANHYPWVVQQQRRGVELVLLGDVPFDSREAWELEVKIRSTRPPRAATIRPLSATEAEVELVVAEEGVSPGQACVFYDPTGTRIFGGGWIHRG